MMVEVRMNLSAIDLGVTVNLHPGCGDVCGESPLVMLVVIILVCQWWCWWWWIIPPCNVSWRNGLEQLPPRPINTQRSSLPFAARVQEILFTVKVTTLVILLVSELKICCYNFNFETVSSKINTGDKYENEKPHSATAMSNQNIFAWRTEFHKCLNREQHILFLHINIGRKI